MPTSCPAWPWWLQIVEDPVTSVPKGLAGEDPALPLPPDEDSPHAPLCPSILRSPGDSQATLQAAQRVCAY